MPGKLSYFDIGVRADAIRALLFIANVEYENELIGMQQWGEMKAAGVSEFGGLPIWTEDGRSMGQCNAVLTFLGRRHGYYSDDPMIAYNIDSLLDFIEDIIEKYGKYILPKAMMGGDLGDVDVFLTGYWDMCLKIIEGRLAAHGKPFVAGTDTPTIADFKVFSQYTTTFTADNPASVIPEDVQAQV